MKHGLIVVCVLALAVTAVAQEKDVTTVTTTETSGADLLSPPLWQFEDAQPIDARKIDLRMGFHWMTASAPASRGDSSDDFILSPTVVWGAAENVQLSLSTPIWLGAGGNVPGLHNGVGDDFDNFRFWDRGDDSDGGLDGQADAYVGLLWKLLDQKGECSQCGHGQFPAVALSATGRFPTGCGSSGIDGELRLIMTYEYDNGIRTHLNGFIKTVNGNNDADARDFQWGAVLGADGPLCSDGAVRWVADYMHRSSYHYGAADLDMLELGWEWQMADAHKLGMSIQAGLDDDDDTPNFGAGLAYSYSLTY